MSKTAFWITKTAFWIQNCVLDIQNDGLDQKQLSFCMFYFYFNVFYGNPLGNPCESFYDDSSTFLQCQRALPDTVFLLFGLPCARVPKYLFLEKSTKRMVPKSDHFYNHLIPLPHTLPKQYPPNVWDVQNSVLDSQNDVLDTKQRFGYPKQRFKSKTML